MCVGEEIDVGNGHFLYSRCIPILWVLVISLSFILSFLCPSLEYFSWHHWNSILEPSHLEVICIQFLLQEPTMEIRFGMSWSYLLIPFLSVFCLFSISLFSITLGISFCFSKPRSRIFL